jgi:hypothetical protein
VPAAAVTGGPWIEFHWPSRLPTPGVVLYVFVFGGLGLAIAIGQIGGASQSPGDAGPDDIGRGVPAAVRWHSLGYQRVASRVAFSEFFGPGLGEFPKDGWIVASMPDDQIDWDKWQNLRLEAWAATVPRNGDGRQSLAPSVAGPYLVVPIPDAWSMPRVAVNVGRPGINAYLLFLIAEDPQTHERVSLGFPGGEDVVFHGNLLDWFSAL